jgi:hypothetical protein
MPHSSGGGSHGGGSHGGSHGGSSGPRTSSRYFAGSRRYRKHNLNTGIDEYVYASSKPQKAGKSSIIFLSVFSAIFLGMTSIVALQNVPHKLKAKYMDVPTVYDSIDVIEDDVSLVRTLNKYQDLTGICTVIYTTYDEDWNEYYEDLEAYTFHKYTAFYKDEAHFVIVYSIPVNERVLIDEDPDYIPDYSWEAVQGDDTDPIITETFFKRFADIVQDGLEDGDNPGEAFNNAFKYANKNAESKLKPGSVSWALSVAGSLAPLLLVAGFLGLFLFLSIKQYRKDKYIEYEEVPFDGSEGQVQDQKIPAGSAVFYTTTYSPSGYKTSQKVVKATSIIGIVFVIPFIVTGLGMIGGGTALLSNVDRTGGIFLMAFGVLWTVMSVFIFITQIINISKARKREAEQSSDVPVSNPASKTPAPPVMSSQPETKQEFDPQFFRPSKSSVEDDDEDYKRMKRQGFE